jgi:hypothetical protein
LRDVASNRWQSKKCKRGEHDRAWGQETNPWNRGVCDEEPGRGRGRKAGEDVQRHVPEAGGVVQWLPQQLRVGLCRDGVTGGAVAHVLAATRARPALAALPEGTVRAARWQRLPLPALQVAQGQAQLVLGHRRRQRCEPLSGRRAQAGDEGAQLSHAAAKHALAAAFRRGGVPEAQQQVCEMEWSSCACRRRTRAS